MTIPIVKWKLSLIALTVNSLIATALEINKPYDEAMFNICVPVLVSPTLK